MITLGIGLAMATALLHATWNVMLKAAGDPLQTSARALASAVLIVSPMGTVVWLTTGRPGMSETGWVLAGLSALAECAYFVFLSEAYRRGELSVVYPLARGVAPVLAVLAGIVILGERPDGAMVGGVALLLSGIWAVRRPIAGGNSTVPALLTGLSIATYSAIDKAGTGEAPPWLYGWVMWCLTALLLVGYVRLGKWPGIFRLTRYESGGANPGSAGNPTWQRSVLVGLMMTTSYLMVLIALSLAPLAIIGPVRESAVVLVTVWGVWRLRERQGMWLRMVGVAGIVTGIVLLVVR